MKTIDWHVVGPDLLEALVLADLMLSGANMDASHVEKKVKAALISAGIKSEQD